MFKTFVSLLSGQASYLLNLFTLTCYDTTSWTRLSHRRPYLLIQSYLNFTDSTNLSGHRRGRHRTCCFAKFSATLCVTCGAVKRRNISKAARNSTSVSLWHTATLYIIVPHRLLSLVISGKRGGDCNGEGAVTQARPVWECLIEESRHSQGKISNDTKVLKTHLFHDPSVVRLWYNTNFQYFPIWNTTDRSVKGI
jgi:hypothetical protein